MYLLTHVNLYNSGYPQIYNTVSKVGKDANLTCWILDTDDLIEERVEKDELLKIIRNNPNIDIKGISHDGQDIKGVYIFGNNSGSIISGDYCLMYEEKTNRGSFVNINLIKKDEGIIFRWQSPHVEGCYTWVLKFDDNKKDILEIELSIRSKQRFYELPSLQIKRNGEAVKLLTADDVRGY